MPETAGSWNAAALVAEDLVPVPEPLLLALQPGAPGTPAGVAGRAARALLDLQEVAPQPPAWLIPHQVPAFTRLHALIHRYGGALLADAVGLGKSYVALAVALELGEPFELVVPAVLVPQWRRLLEEKQTAVTIVTHESLSRPAREPSGCRLSRSPALAPGASRARVIVVDEAHRFRNPDTLRYRRLAERCVGAHVLLVTATPVHNRIADLFHLFRLFLRDDALTALGVGSLRRAAAGECNPPMLAAAAARLTVARSRARARGVAFPQRMPGQVVRAGPGPEEHVDTVVHHIARLEFGGPAAALLRLTLLHRLASSFTAFRATLERYLAFAAIARDAAHAGRALDAAAFQRLFPRTDGADLQLTLLPLLLPPANEVIAAGDHVALLHLKDLAHPAADPKAEALERLLERHDGKTVVFTGARATARYLQGRLAHCRRVAVVTGTSGWFGQTAASRQEVIAAFAPQSQGAAAPDAALATDVLIATDLASEGLNLQDAERVIHYDLPWSPARLAQRVGRIDRLGSPHSAIATISFLPPPVLANALDLERRLADKVALQCAVGAAQRETPSGPDSSAAMLDWCDRLQVLAAMSASGTWAHSEGADAAAVLVVRLGAYTEAVVVDARGARADPAEATRLLERAAGAAAARPVRAELHNALLTALPVIRERLTAIKEARWRAADRDRLSRRLMQWTLAAARRAARSGNAELLQRLDQLVSRLALGMTAGEELGLRALVERHAPLNVRDILLWHERLPPISAGPETPEIQLVAALLIARV